MALEQGKAPLDHELVDIGKEVVKKCANVPLAIRVVGSLLYRQHKSKWLSFKSMDLRKLRSCQDGKDEDDIMPILKYSYHHLSPSLKSCFSYCALFPKDFKINKTKLIWLWMAHDCLDVPNDGQSMEDLGDDYFSILVNRCFFQDIHQGDYGEIYSVKMHDFIHDLALEVAEKESLVLETSEFQFDRKIRHLSVWTDGRKLLSSPDSCLGEIKKLRSLFYNFNRRSYPATNESNVNMICSNLRRLRVLGLAYLELRSLPNTLGNLSHLRYLDLSNNYQLEILPESITKLQNLLVLNLKNTGVRELPKGLRNLHNLRHLDLTYCSNLTHMPVGMDSMVGLQTLSMFVVAGRNSKHVKTGRLKDLRSLVRLQGTLEIIFKRGFSYNLAHAGEVDCLLSDKVHLDKLLISWEKDGSHEHDQEAIHEILLEGLRPHCNIKGIEIMGYKGVKISRWVVSLAVFCPCLVEISLHGFEWLYNLPSLSQLLHLKVLELSSLPNVEYIECDDKDASTDSMSTTSDQLSFFPSLEKLVLEHLPKLKGLRNDVFSRTEAHRELAAVQSFPRLHNLIIEECPCLTAVPQSPGLKTLFLVRVPEEFRFGSINDDSPSDSTFYLDTLTIDKVGHASFLFDDSLKGITELEIKGFRQEMLSEAAHLFKRHASSLRNLYLKDCKELKSLCGGGIEHLTNLTRLSIYDASDLDLGEGDDCGMSPWKSLLNLSVLTLQSLSKLIYLPQGFQYLTSLTSLNIYECSLESLPEWLPCLTSLRLLQLINCKELKSLPEAIRHMPALNELRVYNCKHLTDRCRKTDGQDWPKISHIHLVLVW
ncbi:hypothetical protein vseg_007143 [Gypsophila vaccaria]